MRRWTVFGTIAGCTGWLVILFPSGDRLPQGAAWPWIRDDPARALTLGVQAVGCVIAGWVLAVVALALIARSAGAAGVMAERWAVALTPLAVRSVLEGCLGLTIALGTAGTAIASPLGHAPSATAAGRAIAGVPAPVLAPAELELPDLDRPGTAAPSPESRPPLPSRPAVEKAPAAAPTHVTPTHVVRPGDTLWGLAADRLPATASAARITEAWQQWYLVNRQAIGANPSLLIPGELLRAPELTR